MLHSRLPLEITLPQGARKCLLRSRSCGSRCGSSCNGRRRSRRCWGRSPTWALGALPLLSPTTASHSLQGRSATHNAAATLVTFLLKTGSPLFICICTQMFEMYSVMCLCPAQLKWITNSFLALFNHLTSALLLGLIFQCPVQLSDQLSHALQLHHI